MTTINKRYPQRTFTGTSAAAYAEAAVLYEGSGAVIQIRNTDETSTLKYKISAYLTDDTSALEQVIKAETTLGTTTSSAIITDLNYPFYKAVISVIDGSGHATYQIDAKAYY